LNEEEIDELLAEIGDIGLVMEEALKRRKFGKLSSKRLTISDVYQSLDQISNESGKGSTGRKINKLVKVIVNISPLGARYLARIVTGSLRLGIGDMTILDALSQAYTGSREQRPIIERAYNLTSDLGYVGKTLAESGIHSIKDVPIFVGKPIRMMSAQRLSNTEEVIEKMKFFVAEYKLDGERFQIHKKDNDVQIFSRRLENITKMYPDVVELTREQVKVNQVILEGEAVAVDLDTDEMKPFQILMQRRRKYKIQEMMEKIPVSVYLFDCLYVNGKDLTRKPYTTRRTKLEKVVKKCNRFKLVKKLKPSNKEELEAFFQKSIADGSEGLVIKSTEEDSIYRAGARSWLWVKLKRSYQSKMVDPVDLVVIGGIYGRGRRAGSYGALLAAAYDKENDLFRSVCKVGTGFTDEDLEIMPKLFKKFEVEIKDPRVDSLMNADQWFTPEIVIEILGDELTLSPIHTAAFDILRKESGLAVRFPRFQRWRTDKNPNDATTITELINMYKSQLKTL
jgi:DNA ligase-1